MKLNTTIQERWKHHPIIDIVNTKINAMLKLVSK